MKKRSYGEDFDRDSTGNSDGDEMLEVPAWIAQEYGVFPENVVGEEEIREAVRDPYTNDW